MVKTKVQDLKAEYWLLTPRNISCLFPHARSSELYKEVSTVMRSVLMLQVLAAFSVTLPALFVLIPGVATTGINVPIHRRGGRFSKHEVANFTRLQEVLRQTETRYSRTYRDVGDNSLVRRWAPSGGIIEHDGLLASLDSQGSWYRPSCLSSTRKLTQKQVCWHRCWGAVSEPRGCSRHA